MLYRSWRIFEQNPTEPLRRAIFGMLPHNKLRYQRMTRLRMFPAAHHTQQPLLRAAGGKAFRAQLTADGRRKNGSTSCRERV